MASNSSTKMKAFEDYYKDRQNRQARIDEKIGFDRESSNTQAKNTYQQTVNDFRKPASYKPLGEKIPSIPSVVEFKDTNKEKLEEEKVKKKKTPFISDILGGVKKVGNNLSSLSAKSTGGMDRIQFDENGKMYTERANMEKELINSKKITSKDQRKEVEKSIKAKYKAKSDEVQSETAKKYAEKDREITDKYSSVNDDDKKITKLGKNIAMELPGALSYLLPGGAAIGSSQTYGGSYNRAIQEGKTGIEADKEANKNMMIDAAVDVGLAGVGKLIGKGIKGVKDYKNLDKILDINAPSSVETGNINSFGNKPKTTSKPVKNEPIQNTSEVVKPPVQAVNKPKTDIDLNKELKNLNVKYDNRKFDDMAEIGRKTSTKSITKDMAELQPYLKNEAERELMDLRRYSNNPETTIVDNKKIYQPSTHSNTMEIIKAQTGASYREIEEALEKVAAGKVDDAVSKRVELILDDALTNGTTTVLGDEIPANMDYLDIKNVYKDMAEGKEYDDIFKSAESVAATVEEPKFDNSGMIKNDLAMDTTEGIKQSKHATDTMQNSPNITQEVKDELKKYDFDYEAANNKDTYDKALEFVKDESAISKYLGSSGTNHQDTANGIALIQKLQKEGKIEDIVSVTSKLTDDLTKAGQTVQAASILNRLSPEGRIIYAQRQVKKLQDDVLNKTPGLKTKVDTEVKKLETEIKNSETKAAETLGKELDENLDKVLSDAVAGKGKKGNKTPKEKLTPEQKLANRVDNTLKPKKLKQKNIEDDMVNTLFNISKRNLPEKAKNINDPYQLVKQALENKNEYHSVFNKAKEILKDKYGEGSEQLQILEDWINQKARPIFFEGNMNKAIQDTLKANNIKLSEIVKQHYSVNSKVRKDLATELINKAGLSGDDANTIANYVDRRMKDLTKKSKEAALKRMFADKKGKVTKTQIQKIDELINLGGFDNEKYKSLVFEKLGVPYLDTNDVRKIKSNMDQFHKTKDKDQQEILIAEINQLIQDKKPVKFKDKLNSFRYINMLFNPKTLVKNFTGNVVNTGMGKIRDTVGATIDSAVSKKTGIRTTSGSLEGYGSAYKEGARKTVRDYKMGIDTSLNAKEGARSSAFKGVPILGKAEDLLSLGLQLGDRPFFEGAKNNFIRNYSKMNNIPLDRIPQEVIEEANQVGLEAVYQQKTKLGDFISNAKNKDGLIGLGANALLPFSQTPSAILDTAINYTPVGAFKGVKNLNNAMKTKGLDALQMQRKGVNELASGIVGTGAIAGGYGLAKSGLMTGDLSDDYDTMQLQLQTGQQPYALKLGDTYNSLEFGQPAAMPLMLGADLGQNGKDANLLNAAMDSMLNNSYLDGIPKAFADVQRKGWGSLLTNTASQYASQLMPFNALSNAINKTIDSTKRDTYDKDSLKKLGNQAMSKYPGLSQQLPQKLDSVGNGMEHNEGMNLATQIFNNFINPSTMTKYTPSKTEKKLLDIYNTTGITSQVPKANAPSSFSYGGDKPHVTSAEEQRLYKEIVKKKLDAVNYSDDPVVYEKALSEAYNDWKKQLMTSNGLKKK